MQHISSQRSHFKIALHNAWSRVLYVIKIGVIPGLAHRHTFKQWTGARNLLCWCGGVKLREVNRE